MTEQTVAQTSLIPLWTIEVTAGSETAVNARDLHAFLESKQEFSTWVKSRIEKYEFVQAFDFVVFDNFINDGTAFGGSRKVTEYYLTLDMAKELAMVERNAKGKQARQYFLECERRAKAAQKPMSPAEVLIHQGQLMLVIEQEQARQAEAQRQLETRQAKTEKRLDQIETATDHFTIMGWHRYANQSGSLPLAEAAKMGKAATKFCLDHDLDLGSVPDPRFGTVKTYPKWVLDELFLTTH